MNPDNKRRIGIPMWVCGLAMLIAGEKASFGDLNLKIGDTMPAFSLLRADGTPGAYTHEQLKGQTAAVVFWRRNQNLSLEALRDIRTIAQEIGMKKLRIIVVDASVSSAEQVQAALAGESFEFPILLDPQRALYGKVGVIVCPTTLLFDPQGVLRFKVASHPRQFSRLVSARLRFLVGEIDEEEMNGEIAPMAFKIDHDLAAAWRMYNLGTRLQAEGKSQDAIAAFEKSVARYPSLPEARSALGFTKLAAGNLDVAAEHFRIALTYQPAWPAAKLGQAAVLARTGQQQSAEQILLTLLGRKPIAVRVRYELGRIYRARGELEKAVTFYEDGLSAMFPERAIASVDATSPDAGPARRTQPEGAAQVSAMSDSSISSVGPADQQTPAVQPIVPPADVRYLGVKACKKCHLQQWKSWRDTKMARAFEALKPDVNAESKESRDLDPHRDYTKESQCLRCHTTGFGLAGGYQTSETGDAKAARATRENTGIGCEACHGPGAKYMTIHKDVQDNSREYSQTEFWDAGQYKVDARVCAVCHNETAPCIGPEYRFEFEERKDQGTHRHFELRYRAE